MNVLFSLPIRPRMRLLRGSDIPAFPLRFSGGFFPEQEALFRPVFPVSLCRLSCSRLWILCCDSEFSQVYSAAFAVFASLRYLCRISGCDRGSRKDAVFSAGHSVVFVVLVFRQERFRLCGGIVLRNSPVSGGRRQSAPCPEGFPFTPFSAIIRQLVAAAIKKMKNAAFETAIIQYRMLFRCIPEQKEGVRYLAVANPSG